MYSIKGFEVPKISCTGPTGSEYQCSALQFCCASKCCDKEGLETLFIGFGTTLLIVALIISLVVWCICRRRKLAGKNQQRTTNMLSVGPQNKDVVVDLGMDAKRCGVHTKGSFLPANISFVVPEFPPPNSTLGKTKTGQYDTEPLLSCESSPASLESTCPLK